MNYERISRFHPEYVKFHLYQSAVASIRIGILLLIAWTLRVVTASTSFQYVVLVGAYAVLEGMVMSYRLLDVRRAHEVIGTPEEILSRNDSLHLEP